MGLNGFLRIKPRIAIKQVYYIGSINSGNLEGTTQSFKENSEVILIGHVKEDNIKYSWKRNGTAVQAPSNNGTYKIDLLTVDKIGEYTCTMYDKCDNAIEKTINIEMKKPDCDPVGFTLVAHNATSGQPQTELTEKNLSDALIVADNTMTIVEFTVVLDNPAASVSDYTYEWTTSTGSIVGSAC